ncbi:MAG: sugar phosphate isomerase/epimerase [Ruminiclostridium sp.]|nr:sugar phosphate isomerase/epimerase [Ruminiclostridium sp.]
MLYTGLVSVTFRKLATEDIIKLVVQAGLQGIEWGGHIHVPHGDIKRARDVSKMTEDAGLRVAAYGSYYQVGCEGSGSITFEQVLETAVALQAPTIRVWAGNRGSEDADGMWWSKVINESRRISELAEKVGIVVAFEYHNNTLTDTSLSACRLLKEAGCRNTGCYWQPPEGLDVDLRLYGLMQIMPWLSNIHVSHCVFNEIMPLSDGSGEWQKYMEVFKNISGDRFCMLEFVKNDNPDQFLRDAETLKHMV